MLRSGIHDGVPNPLVAVQVTVCAASSTTLPFNCTKSYCHLVLLTHHDGKEKVRRQREEEGAENGEEGPMGQASVRRLTQWGMMYGWSHSQTVL